MNVYYVSSIRENPHTNVDAINVVELEEGLAQRVRDVSASLTSLQEQRQRSNRGSKNRENQGEPISEEEVALDSERRQMLAGAIEHQYIFPRDAIQRGQILTYGNLEQGTYVGSYTILVTSTGVSWRRDTDQSGNLLPLGTSYSTSSGSLPPAENQTQARYTRVEDLRSILNNDALYVQSAISDDIDGRRSNGRIEVVVLRMNLVEAERFESLGTQISAIDERLRREYPTADSEDNKKEEKLKGSRAYQAAKEQQLRPLSIERVTLLQRALEFYSVPAAQRVSVGSMIR